MTKPVLYSFRRCPYAMRARLALAISKTSCELREVKLADKPPELLAASPKGTVPVLVLGDGSVIEESLAIMHWALGHKDPEGWLARDDAALIAANDGPFKHHLDRYKYPDRYDSDALMHRAEAVRLLQVLEARIASAGQLCGEHRGIADMAIMPFVRQFAAVDPDWFASLPLDHLQEWLAAHLQSALFGVIMQREKPWTCDAAPIAMAL